MNVDFVYYSTVYLGKEADETSFPALCARAEDVISAMVRWKDPSTFTPFCSRASTWTKSQKLPLT